jgi:hypothetical protein
MFGPFIVEKKNHKFLSSLGYIQMLVSKFYKAFLMRLGANLHLLGVLESRHQTQINKLS